MKLAEHFFLKHTLKLNSHLLTMSFALSLDLDLSNLAFLHFGFLNLRFMCTSINERFYYMLLNELVNKHLSCD